MPLIKFNVKNISIVDIKFWECSRLTDNQLSMSDLKSHSKCQKGFVRGYPTDLFKCHQEAKKR